MDSDFAVVESLLKEALGQKMRSVGGFAYGTQLQIEADEPGSRGLSVMVEVLDAGSRTVTAGTRVVVVVTTGDGGGGGFACERKDGRVAFCNDEFVGERLMALKKPVKLILESLF